LSEDAELVYLHLYQQDIATGLIQPDIYNGKIANRWIQVYDNFRIKKFAREGQLTGRNSVNAAFARENEVKNNLQVTWKYFDTTLQ